MAINALIIDDESSSRDALAAKLRKCAPDVVLAGMAQNATEGLEMIHRLKPELVFLDIEMPVMNGFSMLEHLDEIPFEVVFTTAYDQYAITAFRFSALNYLLKPIDVEELEKTMAQFRRKKEKQNQGIGSDQLQFLLQTMKTAGGLIQKLALPTAEGFQMVSISEITRLQSDSNYTLFFLAGGKPLMVSRTMKEYEEMLEEYNFFRVHNSHIINLQHMQRYVKGEGGYVVMNDGTTIEVSVRRKPGFLQKLTRL